jgi:DNA-binding HxlR family transcriptional regulator
MTVLQGRLADRDAWSAVGKCPIREDQPSCWAPSRAMHNAGGLRHQHPVRGLWRRVGVTKAAASARLNELVDAGLLERRPYKEPGQRSRDEYVLTDAGTDFMPVVWAMFEWGRRHLPHSPQLRLAHRDCGAEAAVEIYCERGHHVPADELVVQLANG